MSLPTDAQERKQIPMFFGLFRYFPHALAAVAQLSWVGDRQHNPGKAPGEPPHWAKEKSTDELDAQLRHVLDAAINEEHRDPDGILALVKNAWRALANLERMHDRGVDIFWAAPGATADAAQVEPAPAKTDIAQDGNYLVQVKIPLDNGPARITYFGPYRTRGDVERAIRTQQQLNPNADLSVHSFTNA